MFALLALSGFAGVVHGGATRVAPMAWSIARDVDGAALVDRPDACGFASRVAPDGLIRFVYGEGSRLYFGKEGGAPGVPITGPTVPCQDPDLAFKPDGTAVVGWIDSRNRGIDLWNTDAFVATEDSGWQESLVTGSTDGRVEALRIDVDAAGIVHALYRRFTLQIWPYDDFLFAASSPSWQEAQVSDGHAINTFDLGFDSRGNTHVTWFSTDGYYAVWYANESAGWADVRVDKDQDLTRYDARFDASIAVDASDVPHVVWADSRNAPQYGSWRSEIWHASSVDGFTNRELVQPDDASLIVRKRGPHLLIDGAGVFHVAFTGDVEDASYQTSTNLYYGSSTDWDRAVQITNATGVPDRSRGRLGQRPDRVVRLGLRGTVHGAPIGLSGVPLVPRGRDVPRSPHRAGPGRELRLRRFQRHGTEPQHEILGDGQAADDPVQLLWTAPLPTPAGRVARPRVPVPIRDRGP